MAKGDKAKAAAAVTTVTIKELETKHGMDARKIRGIIRSLGMKAPEVKSEGFGPKAKYEWPSDSADLAKIQAALVEAGKPKEAKAPAEPVAPAATDDDDDD